MILAEPEFETESAFRLRHYQSACTDAVDQGWRRSPRQLIVHATGTGKGSMAAHWAKETVAAGKRMLFLAHRESLVTQTAKRIREQAGIDVDVEMASDYASPNASVVCASVQSLSNQSRLTGFADDHFALVLADEGHHSLANSWQRILNYFHFGAESLNEDWKMPTGDFIPKARVIGMTATPDLSSKRNLGEFYISPHLDRPDAPTHEYNLLDGVNDGYLVRPIAKSIPLEIDLRGLTAKRTSHGSDLSDAELTARMEPVIDALADQIVKLVPNRKTVAFLPSVKCATLLSEAITARGMRGMIVSGAMDDSMDVLDQFRAAGPGTVICNASLIVEGVDIPDVSCVLMARATKSRAFYVQCAGRASRPFVEGGVDQYTTAEERLAAIAASSKPDFLILDPLWVSDRLKLIRPCSLVSRRPQTEEALASTEGDLVKAEAEAERDFLAALAKEAKKHQRKQGVTFDPIAKDLSLTGDSIRNYKPEFGWEVKPMQAGEKEFLQKNGIDTSAITCSGMAQKIIDTIVQRDRMGLASPKMLTQLMLWGWPEEKVVKMTKGQAGVLVGKHVRYKEPPAK